MSMSISLVALIIPLLGFVLLVLAATALVLGIRCMLKYLNQ